MSSLQSPAVLAQTETQNCQSPYFQSASWTSVDTQCHAAVHPQAYPARASFSLGFKCEFKSLDPSFLGFIQLHTGW
eukprot:1873985-Rhodomonas_salina.1